MIDSLIEDLPQPGLPDDEQIGSAADARDRPFSESSWLAALPIVRRIVGRRRSSLNSDDASDLLQEVALRLWRWSTNHREKSEKMSNDDWSAFAARTAYNEVKRYFSGGNNLVATVHSPTVSEIEGSSLEGQTDTEVFSLIQQVWQGICQLSLRQRRALLLHSQELVIYFMQSGITERELATTLGVVDVEWNDIRDRLPLSDLQIAEITLELGQQRKIKSIVGSIKKARYEARKKLEGLQQR